MPVVTPEEAAREIQRNAGPSAILFGAERSGLETEEVALAGKIVTVPVNPDFRSLNLAQAVILIAYEWSKHGRRSPCRPQGDPAEPRASQEHLEGLIGQLDEALEARRLFPPARPHAGDPQHDPHHPHQGRLVDPRGAGAARHRPRARRAAPPRLMRDPG